MKDQRALLLGMGIGDGHITVFNKYRKDASGTTLATYKCGKLVLRHSVKQSDFIQHKIDLLQSVFGGNKLKITKTSTFLRATGKEYQLVQTTKTDPYFKGLHSLLYSDNGKKKITRRVLDELTPQAIAIWYMDDGNMKANRRLDGRVGSVSTSLSTYCPKDEAEDICRYFSEVWGISFRPAFHSRFNSYYLRANTANSRLFVALIEKYVIPSMHYKIAYITDVDLHEPRASGAEVAVQMMI